MSMVRVSVTAERYNWSGITGKIGRINSMSDSVTNTVHALRIAKNLTQEELGDMVDVSRQTIIAIEKGNYVPSVLLALKLAKVFKVQVDDIFKVSHEK